MGNKPKNVEDYRNVIFYDLEALKDTFIINNKEDFDYHFKLLKGNLSEFFKVCAIVKLLTELRE